jgi:hypothetical protein
LRFWTTCIAPLLIICLGAGCAASATEPAKGGKTESSGENAEQGRRIEALTDRLTQTEKALGESTAAASKSLDDLRDAIQSQAVRLDGAEKKIDGDPNKERLQTAAWGAALIAAFVAALSFRKSVYQSRATTLLAIQKQSDELGDSARAVATLRNEMILFQLEKQQSGMSAEEALQAMRAECNTRLKGIQIDSNQLDLYRHYMRYIGFFEKAGLMVRYRYIPLRDLVALYKGPILEVQNLFGDHIQDLQKDQPQSTGIFENALWLEDQVVRYDRAPSDAKLWRDVKDWF